MERPQVRIVQDQQEEIKPMEVSNFEREMLLAKYGYGQTQQNIQQQSYNPEQELSFEELCRREEQKIREERERLRQKMMGPKPISFSGDYDSYVKYDSEDGLNFKIEVTSNMNLPKNRY